MDLSTPHSQMDAQHSVQHTQGVTDSHLHPATVKMESKLPKHQHVVKAGQATVTITHVFVNTSPDCKPVCSQLPSEPRSSLRP